MKLSPYFHDLRSAYQAELDDLASDSEGNDVLRRRLADKRGEIAFLAKMIELAPEMVAPVFHGAFRFAQPAAVQHLLALPQEAVPGWQDLAHAVTLEPWAQSLAQTVLREPQGGRFMAVAAGLEYLHQHARMAPAPHAADEPEEETTAEHEDGYDALSADDAVEPQSHHEREEAGAEWLAGAGFDRKD